MKTIPLTQGRVAIVDDADFESLNKFKWCCSKFGYAVRAGKRDSNSKQPTIRMHRVIINAPKNYDVDHANRNRIDNRKENLRICTASENQWNRGTQQNNTTGFKGVSWSKSAGKFRACVRVGEKRMYLEYYFTAIDAAKAYDAAAIKMHGEFARGNNYITNGI